MVNLGFGVLFSFFPLMVLIVMTLFIIVIFKNVGEWKKNNDSPRLTVAATAVAKRQRVSGGGANTMASTTYYVTFEVESGDRMELRLSGREYGMLSEGDIGKLTFQGTRFLSFERIRR